MPLEEQLLNRTIQVPDEPPIFNPKLGLKRSDLYRLALSRDPSFDGQPAEKLQAVKKALAAIGTSRSDDVQQLFEKSYGLGQTIDQQGYDPAIIKAIEAVSTLIYLETLFPQEQTTPEGKRYLPQDTVGSLIKLSSSPAVLAQQVFLAGFSAGVLFRNQDQNTMPTVAEKPDQFLYPEFLDFLRIKPELKTLFCTYPSETSQIFFKNPGAWQSETELSQAEQLSNTCLPIYLTKRVGPIITGKRQTKTLKKPGFFVSWWSIQYEDPYLEIAAKLISPEVRELRNEREVLTGFNRRLVKLASRIGRLQLAQEVFVRDLGAENIPIELEDLASQYLATIAQSVPLPPSNKELFKGFVDFITSNFKERAA
ncbi:MAG: hypothetical protein JW991_02635 [Candidatus Pacebacteria bacterium]|nr:hypothetical protein [Candidatus Paceibacterota bacterium]